MFLVSLLSDGGTIKDKSPTFSVSGVKGNLSYKITNTFITHLTGEGEAVNCKCFPLSFRSRNYSRVPLTVYHITFTTVLLLIKCFELNICFSSQSSLA